MGMMGLDHEYGLGHPNSGKMGPHGITNEGQTMQIGGGQEPGWAMDDHEDGKRLKGGQNDGMDCHLEDIL